LSRHTPPIRSAFSSSTKSSKPARRNAAATATPPKPAPMIATRGCTHCSAQWVLIAGSPGSAIRSDTVGLPAAHMVGGTDGEEVAVPPGVAVMERNVSKLLTGCQ
jgi:hypothetical protein